MDDYSQHLTFAQDLAREAGSLLREGFKLGQTKQYKSDQTAVTELDEKINHIVIEKVKSSFPGHGVLGEEASLEAESEFIWVCDPLDGTLGFMSGIPTFVFSLSLLKDGQPVVAVVYDPILDRLFQAVKGQGCLVNDRPVAISHKAEVDNAALAVPYRKGWPFDRKSQFMALFDQGAKVFNLWSIIYAGGLVAAGELDGVVFMKDAAYDVAALALLIEEAGGVVTDLDGHAQRYDQPTKGFIGANAELHARLVEVMAAQ